MASLTQHDTEKGLFRIRIYCPLLTNNDNLMSSRNEVNPIVEASLHSERLLPAIVTYCLVRYVLKVLQPRHTTESVVSTHEKPLSTPSP